MKLLIEILKTILLGLVIAIAVFIITFAIAYLITHEAAATLEACRSAILIVGSLGLVFSAGMMVKRSKVFGLNSEIYKKHFAKLALHVQLIIISASIIAPALILDYLMYTI